MKESGYYPAGAEFDPSAPYNEEVVPNATFDCIIKQTLSKNVKVTTNDYNPERDDEDGNIYYNTENTDWDAAYRDDGHYTILELLDELKEYVKHDMDNSAFNSGRYRHCKRILEEIDGWECDESNIE